MYDSSEFSEKIRKFGAMEQESEYYTVKSSVYANRLLMIALSRLWWAAALPIAVLFVLSLSDIRFLFVAFMLLLTVFPGVLAMVYFRVKPKKRCMDFSESVKFVA